LAPSRKKTERLEGAERVFDTHGIVRSRACTAFVAIAWLAASSGQAQENERTATLTYRDLSSSSDCPDDTALRAAVAARLGYDPFRAEAPLALGVTIDRQGPRLIARVEVGEGEAHRIREFAGRRGACAELGTAVVLALAIAIVPPEQSAAPEEPPPEQSAAAEEPPLELTIERDPEPRPWRAQLDESPAPQPPAEDDSMRATLWVGAGIALLQLPAPSFGVRAGVELTWPFLAVALGGRAFLPASAEIGVGSVEAALYAGETAVCLRFGELAGACALAVAGSLVGSASGLVGNRYAAGFALSLGARASGTLRLGESPWSLRIELDVLVPIVRWGILVGSAEVWRAPPIGLNAGFFVGIDFP
jgi:hypothetical protein